jgi:subtilisin family serine protease
MKDCLSVNSIKPHKYCSYSNGRLTGLVLFAMISLLIFVSSSNKLWTAYQASNEYKHTYLVKLNYLPIFNKNVDSWFANWQVYLTDMDDSNWNFDVMLEKYSAKVEDLYPDSNTGELGKWIIVRSRNDITPELLLDVDDVDRVEDGSLLLKLPEDGDKFAVYTNGINTVKDDKTWGLRLPKVEEALNILKPTRNVTVAVVDTGCDLKHPALKDNLIQGRNFAGGDANDASNRNPNEMHATHVTGTIVAKSQGKYLDFHGIATKVASVMPVRVLNESGSGSLQSVCQGIEYATKHGANVINMSLGTTQYSRALEDATTDAINAGVAVVCAKGNSNTNKPNYPSDLPGVIRVTATSLKDDKVTEERAFFSNYGDNSTCSAPGHFTFSTLPGGKYGFASGTSMACPHAAACAAVILSQGNFTPKQVEDIMKFRGDDLKTDRPIGKRINLLNFVQKAKHDLMSPNDYNNHPYDKCCVSAGIIARMTTKIDEAGTTNIYQDADGKYDATLRYNCGDDWYPVRTMRNNWNEDFLTLCRYKNDNMWNLEFSFSKTSPFNF